ncbi:hypothetical protein GLOTRDRAFT_61485 [Gloeophyllum trabeum ATCC 11539]|uniref:GST N-terminal domain-containing protein n=1 Tax=Gloeophyllum trabeum (strain ATCC 11539 / FP-39264 / Madison 617) TaxID=670483 RepID=S7RJ90_GLOTA|nr:uncharacterized protein GLOTRDRAFT_61485 [Gloeophyllum trabeum ATCC 11539]EPQ54410.1 hypothetical protein GLOTRDRAFT_61485 [Gloeophyllum trabeum ATCC 11539]
MFEIVLYDLPRKDPESGPWSPNTLKTRLALKYKGLPFKTVWLEYPDIVAECKKIGAPPTGAQPDGSPFYTLPVIYDPSTKKAVADSYAIAEYLDATYPTDRQLMPAGTEGLHAAFYSAFDNHGFFPLVFVYGPLIPTILNPPSEEYFRRTKKETLEQMAQTEQDEALRKGKAGFDVIQGWYEKAGKGKLFLMGDTPSWADIVVASTLASARNILGRHSEAWKAISEWHGGRWVRLTAALAE